MIKIPVPLQLILIIIPINDRLVKLDILGHDDPTVIRMLEDMLGIPAKSIPFGDPETMSLFSSTRIHLV